MFFNFQLRLRDKMCFRPCLIEIRPGSEKMQKIHVAAFDKQQDIRILSFRNHLKIIFNITVITSFRSIFLVVVYNLSREIE